MFFPIPARAHTSFPASFHIFQMNPFLYRILFLPGRIPYFPSTILQKFRKAVHLSFYFCHIDNSSFDRLPQNIRSFHLDSAVSSVDWYRRIFDGYCPCPALPPCFFFFVPYHMDRFCLWLRKIKFPCILTKFLSYKKIPFLQNKTRTAPANVLTPQAGLQKLFSFFCLILSFFHLTTFLSTPGIPSDRRHFHLV